MSNKYCIILSKKNNLHSPVNGLGHEIHFARFILMDLLTKNLINSDSTIITLNEDRFILYDKIFTNVITWDEYNSINKKDNVDEIDLSFYNTWENNKYQIPIFDKIGYHLNLFENTDRLIKYINDINFCDLTNDYSNIIKNKFIVLHLRSNIIGVTKDNSDILNNIINKVNNKYKIVVFSVENINISNENIIFINNLQLYCSFLNHKNCELFISEWSGGGQLSQYCSNAKIIYYFDTYPSNGYELNYEFFQLHANSNNNIFNCWDFKTTTNCTRLYFKTFDLVLEYLNSHI